METTVKPQKDSTIRVTTVIAEDERKVAEEKALSSLASRVRIKGFRPGKAPPSMVKEQIDPSDVLEETVRQLLPQIMKEAMEKSKAQPILKPHVNIENVSPLTVVCVFTERPKVTLKKPEKIAVEKKDVKSVSKEEVEKFVRRILEQDRTDTPVERAAKEGDAVKVGLTSVDMKGESVADLTVNAYTLVPGHEDLLPELAKEVVGLKKGDKKSVKVSFGKEHEIPALRGKTLKVDMEVKEVSEVKFPELTQEYLKDRLKADKTPEAFRKDIEEMIRSQRDRAEMKRREEELYSLVRQAVQMEIPKTLLDAEAEGMLLDFEERLKEQQSTLGEWLRKTKKTPEDFMKELQSMSRDRILLRYGMQELAEHKQIKPSDEEVKTFVGKEHEGHHHEEGEYEPGGSLYENARWTLTMQRLVDMMIK